MKKYFLLLSLLAAVPLFGMHIMEGFLPPQWSGIWFALTLPFWLLGIRKINSIVKENPSQKLLIGLCIAFCFVLSSLKIPSVTGSCSHPTGVGLGVMMFGPLVMTVGGSIVLLFQALLLAHGGLTTLGANTFSMAIAGPLAGYLVYLIMRKMKINQSITVFAVAFVADIFTYIVTSLQLALAFGMQDFGAVSTKFLTIFAVTQIPLAVSEGLLTVLIVNLITKYDSAGALLLNKPARSEVV